MQIQTPFPYDPTQGNLLVEVLNIGDYTPAAGASIDVQSESYVATLVTEAGKQDSATGIRERNKPVTQFEFGVPEPSTLALATLALLFGLPDRGSAEFRGHSSAKCPTNNFASHRGSRWRTQLVIVPWIFPAPSKRVGS